MNENNNQNGYPIQGAPGPQKDIMPELINGTVDPGSIPVDPESGKPLFAPPPLPLPGKEYNDPLFSWWLNAKGTWNCTATFISKDGEDSQRVDAPLINYHRDEEAGQVTYTAEVTFGDKEYTSPEFVISIANSPEQPDHTDTSNLGDDSNEVHNDDAAEEGGNVIPFPGNKADSETPKTSPKWYWWTNSKGVMNCTAMFEAIDGNDPVNLTCDVIHYKFVDEGVEYKAEVDYNGETYVSEPIILMKDQKSGENVVGRGLTKPFGSYAAELDEGQTEPKLPPDEPKAIEDEANPLSDMSEARINMLLRQLQEGVKMMEGIWNTTRNEFSLTDSMMKELYKFNSDHAEKMPDGLSKEEQDKWDYFNGLDGMTEDDVVKIFGADSKIIGVEHGVTMSRVKEAANDLFAWTYALREYTNVHNAYMALIEEQEEKYIQELKDHAEAEEDPEKRKAMADAIDFYYYRKRLGFLANPEEITPEVRTRIHRARETQKTLEYWIKRSCEKLTKMKISNKVILEISKFESRFLPEKYHKIDNTMLTYFLNICTYCKPDDKKDAGRNMVVCMVFALDQLIRNVMPDPVKEEVLKNILTFEEMMYKEIIGDETESSEEQPDMSELKPEEKPEGLAGDFSNGSLPSQSNDQ